MIRTLITLLLLVGLGWIGYVSFWGDEDDKALRNELFDGVKKTINATGKIFQSEKSKFDSGDYDGALDKISKAINDLKSQAGKMKDKEKYLDKLKELNEKKDDLEKKIDSAKNSEGSEAISESEAQKELKDISGDLLDLINTMDKE